MLGGLLFAAGLAFIAADVVPFFVNVHNRPLWLNLACLLAPVGFAVAIGSAVREGRAQQRAALKASVPARHPPTTNGPDPAPRPAAPAPRGDAQPVNDHH